MLSNIFCEFPTNILCKKPFVFSLQNRIKSKTDLTIFFRSFPSVKYTDTNTIICAVTTYHLIYPCVQAIEKNKFSPHTIKENIISSIKSMILFGGEASLITSIKIYIPTTIPPSINEDKKVIVWL